MSILDDYTAILNSDQANTPEAKRALANIRTQVQGDYQSLVSDPGFHANEDAQQVAHKMRAAGIVKDPTQGGAVQTAPAPKSTIYAPTGAQQMAHGESVTTNGITITMPGQKSPARIAALAAEVGMTPEAYMAKVAGNRAAMAQGTAAPTMSGTLSGREVGQALVQGVKQAPRAILDTAKGAAQGVASQAGVASYALGGKYLADAAKQGNINAVNVAKARMQSAKTPNQKSAAQAALKSATDALAQTNAYVNANEPSMHDQGQAAVGAARGVMPIPSGADAYLERGQNPADFYEKNKAAAIGDAMLFAGGLAHGVPNAIKGARAAFQPESVRFPMDATLRPNRGPLAPGKPMPAPRPLAEPAPAPMPANVRAVVGGRPIVPVEYMNPARPTVTEPVQSRRPAQVMPEAQPALAPKPQPAPVQPELRPEVQPEAASDILNDIRNTYAEQKAQEASAKPLHEMTPGEIDNLHGELSGDGSQSLVRVFGTEGATRYRKLERTANSTYGDRDAAMAASAEMQKMEDGLAPAQQRDLYGQDMPYAPDDVKDFKNADISAADVQDASENISYAMAKLHDPSKPPSEMTHTEQVALYRIKNTLANAKANGLDTAAITDAAIKHMANRFKDPRDFELMTEKYRELLGQMKLKPKQSQPTIAPAKPKQLTAPSDAAPATPPPRPAQATEPVAASVGQEAGKQPWEMGSKEFIQSKPLPPQERLPEDGHYAAIRTDDGSIYVDKSNGASTHQLFAERIGIPPSRIVDGGWMVDGDYRPTERSDSASLAEKGRAAARVEHKTAIRKALADGKPVPPEVLADYPDLAKPVAAPDLQPTAKPAATGDAVPSGGTPVAVKPTIQDHRANAVLQQKRNYDDGGIQTRQEFIDRKLSEGSKPEINEEIDHAATDKLKAELDRMRRQGEPSGNPNWPATKKYREVEAAIKTPIMKQQYWLRHSDGKLTVFTKTEHDYAVSRLKEGEANPVEAKPKAPTAQASLTRDLNANQDSSRKPVVDDFQSVASKKYPNVSFKLIEHPTRNQVSLHKLVVDFKDQRKGVGSAFLKDLTDHADKNGITLTLHPGGDFGGNVARLKEFYSRAGFVRNVGDNRIKIGQKYDDWYRKPKAQTEPLAASEKSGASSLTQDAPSRKLATSKRIEVAPIEGGTAKPLTQITDDFIKASGINVRHGKQRRGVSGHYTPSSTDTSVRYQGDLDTFAHEAAHAIDDKHGILGDWAGKDTSPYDTELKPFSEHGSKGDTLTYTRAEGMAEWLRAYIVNPEATTKAAPKFTEYALGKVDARTTKALESYSKDWRELSGADAVKQTLANIKMTRDDPSAIGKVRKVLTEALAKRNPGDDFQVPWASKMKAVFTDAFDPFVTGQRVAMDRRGIGELLPEDNPETLLRAYTHMHGKVEDIYEHGLTDAKGKRVTEGFRSLIEPFDNSSPEAFDRDMGDAVAYMVAQRTREIGNHIADRAQGTVQRAADAGILTPKREAAIKAAGERMASRVSGIGRGEISDQLQAANTLKAIEADPARLKVAQEAAKRYREWANKLLDYQVEKGRLSADQVDAIKNSNQFYVAFKRVIDNDLAPLKKGGKLASSKQTVYKFKGSTREINNPYADLAEQTVAAVREADRNEVLGKYRDLLTTDRPMYNGKPVNLASIGRRVAQGDQNTIKIFVDGKPEYWQFNDDIAKSLKGSLDFEFPKWAKVLSAPAGLMRSAITHAPQFVARNVWRDTLERLLKTRTNGKLGDTFHKYSDQEKRDLKIFGGSNSGHYFDSQSGWHEMVQKATDELLGANKGMKVIRKKTASGHITVSVDTNGTVKQVFGAPRAILEQWKKIGESAEQQNRLAEYKSAYKHAREVKGYDEYNASLYAAHEAANMLDFAKAGTFTRWMNKFIPFTNASTQGLVRDMQAIKENPGRFAAKWVATCAVPTAMVYAWNAQNGNIDEYRQLPAWRRDMFWNVKIGGVWLSMPKPFVAGVMASGIDRAFDKGMGNKNAFEGYGGSVARAVMPVDETAILGGGAYGPYIETLTNYDWFRDNSVIPDYEKNLDVEYRHTERGSVLGQGIANATDAVRRGVGLKNDTDSRAIDHIISGVFGGQGQLAIGISNAWHKDVKLGEPNGNYDKPLSAKDTGLMATGFVTSPPASAAPDVQYVSKTLAGAGVTKNPLKEYSDAYFAAKTIQERDVAAKAWRQAAKDLRGQLELMPKGLTAEERQDFVKGTTRENTASAPRQERKERTERRERR